MYPVFLDLTGKLAVVVGYGEVGGRKAAGLLAAGARVRVVCLEPPRAEVGAEWFAAPYEPAHLAGASLVLACATDEVNAAVVADAKSRGLWVLDAAAPSRGDFRLGAVHRDGGLVVSVSTSGASPAVAALLRDRIAAHLGPGVPAELRALEAARRALRDLVPDGRRRRGILKKLARPENLHRLATLAADDVLGELSRLARET